MIALEILKSAEAAGVKIALDGTDLKVTAKQKPPAPILDGLRKHKAEIVSLLTHGQDDWSPEDYQAFYDERAGIAEYDGRQTRGQAEAAAYEFCVTEWLNRHPEPSQPDCCAWCAKPGTECSIVPFLAGNGGHTWLHPECWEDWHQDRRSKAQQALGHLGIKV